MSVVKNYGLTGVGTNVEVGKGGPRIKNISGEINIRNAVDDALDNLAVADPTNDSHAATKAYVDRKAQIRVVAQVKNDVFRNPADTADYTPNAGDIAIVTTVGTTYDTLGRLVKYDGTSWAYLFSGGESDGLTMQTGDAITGGTDTYQESHVYMWETSAWTNIGPSTTASGTVLGVQGNLAYDGSSATLKTGLLGRVVRVIVNVTTAFNGTAGDATLTVGDDTITNRLAAADEIDLYTIGVYIIDTYYEYTSGTDVEYYYTADSNADASAGACEIELQYASA